MPRIPRVRGLSSLQLAAAAQSSSTAARVPFAACHRSLTTTCAIRGKNTDWVRGKLWKGEAPGPEDPYTQRPEPEDPSNLPEEAFQSRVDRTPAAVRDSELVLPPKRTEAASEKELKSSDPTYVPATDADGLEEIDTIKTWWDQPGHWGEESGFKGFGSAEKIGDAELLEVYLRRAVIEILALRETGVFSEWATKKWSEGSRNELDRALAVEIQVQDGQASLKGDASSIAQSITAEVEDAELGERITLEEAREMVKAWDPSWKNLALDEELKFTLRKRLYQLTGNLIPDAKLGAATTVKHVLTVASKQPKQQKLAEALEQRSDLQKLGNVKIHSRKIGPIEKETSVGRWKVIEEELTKRGLPVTGTDGLSKNKERDWISGKV